MPSTQIISVNPLNNPLRKILIHPFYAIIVIKLYFIYFYTIIVIILFYSSIIISFYIVISIIPILALSKLRFTKVIFSKSQI